MRPIELQFNGINSYTEEQNINFETLTKYKVFGIVGKTGAGKTTILDAIILALYGRIPRNDKSKERSFFNYDKKECFVKFKFSVFNNGDYSIYQIQRNFKLKKDDKIDCYKSSIVRFDEDIENVLCSNKVTELNECVIDIIGLNYDDFTKAVILPQGKFSEFLTLKNADKGEMLGRIFSLEKYGDKLSEKFNKEKKDTESKIANLNSVKIGIGIDTDTDVKSIENELILLNKDKKVNLEQKEIINKKLDLQKETSLLLSEYINNQKNKAKLEEQKESIDILESNIDKYKNANSTTNIVYKIDKFKSELIILNKNEKTINDKIGINKNQLLKYEIDMDNFSSKKEKEFQELLGEIVIIKSLIEDDNLLENDKKQRVVLLEEYKENEIKLETNQKKLVEINKKIESLTNSESSLNKLLFENTIKIENINNINLGIKYDFELNEIVKKIDNYKLSEKNLLLDKNELLKSKEKLVSLEKSLNVKLISQKEDKKIYYSSLLKKELTIGDICPICGDIITQLDKDITISNNVDENLEKTINENIININNINNKIESNQNEYNKLQIELKEFDIKKIKLEENLLELKEVYGIVDFNEEHIKIAKKEKCFESISKEINTVRANIDINKKNKDLIEAENHNISILLNNIKNKGSNIAQRINEINSKISLITKGENVEKYLGDLLSREKYFKDTEKLLKDKIISIKEQLTGLTASLLENTTNISSINNQIVDYNKMLDDIIFKYDFYDLEDIKKYIVADSDLVILIEKIQNYKNDSHLINEKIKQNIEKLSELKIKYNSIDISEVNMQLEINENRLKDINIQIEDNTKNIAKLDTKLQIIKKDIEKIKQIDKKLKILKTKLDNIIVITNLLSGNKFVKYIAKRYLDYICADASERLFLMSGKKYSLAQDDTDFIIIDHFRGNIKRQVSSISGGEQFMVSLCLALSLSTYISRKNNGMMNMFFLDEGFGSLDDETLDNVVDILFKASRDELSIGLITHVTKLQENLPRKLYVTQNEKTLSSEITLC